MAAHVVRLPDVGEGVAEAEIVAWHVAVGDHVGEDDAIVEVMTDKATVELPSPVAGTIARLGGEVGDIVPVGSDLVWIDVAGAQRDDEQGQPEKPTDLDVDQAPAEDSATDSPTTTDTTETTDAPAASRPAGRAPSGAAPTAAPAVRKRAKTLGIDLDEVAGHGPDGLVRHEDLDEFITSDGRGGSARRRVRTSAASDGEVELVKVAGLRRNIAARMQEAHRIPHFTYVEEVDVTELERLRAELNQRGAGADAGGDEPTRLTLLPFLMRAVVVAVGEYPQMNARFRDDEGVVERHRAVHLGIAVQTSKGLMVPVVKHAGDLDLWESAGEVGRLSDAARAAKVTLEELSGSTITITSLGALGGLASTPIINAPEVAIIGVNKIAERAVRSDGAWLPRQFMNLSSSFDHRVIDGWDAAQFIQRVRSLLERPALLFLTTHSD